MSQLISYSKLTKSDFFTFFNLNEIRSERNSPTVKIIKPGGFQEYIDIEFHLNKKGEIIMAKLTLDRQWIGNVETLIHLVKILLRVLLKQLFHLKKKREKII